MARVAQTIVELYAQVQAAARSDDELLAAARAYGLTKELYSGYFMADGRPFVCHAVGVASIALRSGLPTDAVVFGLLHNVYGNGDFGDARRFRKVEPWHRAKVRAVAGAAVEDLLFRFQARRFDSQSVASALAELDGMDADDKLFAVMNIADLVEKLVGANAIYEADNAWILDAARTNAAGLDQVARRLGLPVLADLLQEGLDECAAAEKSAPEAVRTITGQRYMKLFVPASCGPRLLPMAIAWARRQQGRLHRALKRRLFGPGPATRLAGQGR